STMAVPQGVALARTAEAFRYATVLALLRCGDLRFISIWHPSFLTLLLDMLAARWQELLDDVRDGTCVHSQEFPAEAGRTALARPNTRRAKGLNGIAASDLARIWPQLKIVSCWGDGPSMIALGNLRSRLPRVHIQPKGLIATEAIVSIPFRARHPLALDSHFFEFIGSDGAVRLAGDLNSGEVYEVLVTTGGGLWRYKLSDRIKVTGFVGRTPSIEFLSRSGIVSDQCGEKLSEGFVAQVFALVFGGGKTARFAMLAPDENAEAVSYTLYLEGECPRGLVGRLESALCANSHYAYCRKLGQLERLRLFSIRNGGYEAFVKRQAARGARIGDVKPAVLSCATGWSQIFDGAYACQ
ncbi:MAG: GH3 family domain-containing protein, partial [Gammaproteobacteria bacterium]